MNQARIQECLVIRNWLVGERFGVNPESFDVDPENYDVDPDRDDPQATDGQKENSACCFLCLCCR